MFGYAAFAQPAFAALGSYNYALSIIEAFTAGDIQVGGFFVTVTENISVLDLPNGGRPYSVSITEPQSIADAAVGLANYVGVVSESILSEYDAEAVVATFVTFITEALTVNNTQSAILQFGGFVTEGIGINDINQVAAAFNKAQTENINLLDSPIGFAWVKIDNTEGTQWVLIDNRQ